MFKRCSAFILAGILLMGVLSDTAASEPAPSAWAQAEVQEAIQLGFVPEFLQTAYQENITRAEFAEIALQFLAVQYNYTLQDFLNLCREIPEIAGNYQSEVFQDTDNLLVNWAYAWGIVNGRGDGTFDPDGQITRQEAAKILQNTYSAYGGADDISEGQSGTAFSDAGQIDSWARESVSLMQGWGVMTGTSGDTFSPLGSYTREQCIITFLRLLKNGPVSVLSANVQPLLTYEEELQRTLEGEGIPDVFTVEWQMETPDCTVLYGYHGGHMHAYSAIHIVYRSGGRKGVDASAVADTFALDTENAVLTFSDVMGNKFSLDLQTAALTAD